MSDDLKSATTEINIAGDNDVIQELFANQYGRLDEATARAALESHYVTVWNEQEFQNTFDVRETSPPYVHVAHKDTGQLGTVIYVDSPRFYFLFNPEIPSNE
jgi:hypothetical protein